MCKSQHKELCKFCSPQLLEEMAFISLCSSCTRELLLPPVIPILCIRPWLDHQPSGLVICLDQLWGVFFTKKLKFVSMQFPGNLEHSCTCRRIPHWQQNLERKPHKSSVWLLGRKMLIGLEMFMTSCSLWSTMSVVQSVMGRSHSLPPPATSAHVLPGLAEVSFPEVRSGSTSLLSMTLSLQ